MSTSDHPRHGFVTIKVEDDRSSGEVVVGFPIEYLSLSPADLFDRYLKPAIQEAIQQPAVKARIEKILNKGGRGD